MAYKPRQDQFNAEQLTTRHIQLWKSGIMMTALLTLEEARKLVNERKCFVMTEQAIAIIETEEA